VIPPVVAAVAMQTTGASASASALASTTGSASSAIAPAAAAAVVAPLTNGLVYVPVGNCHNTLLHIHAGNSFCFRTKERVPYMVVFEVLEYATAQGGPIVPAQGT